jgi:hypothetical protein
VPSPLLCVRARAQVITFRDVPGKSRGFGFVVYDTAADAAQAVAQLNGHVLSGRALAVSIAEPREPRFPRQQHGHGGGDAGAPRADTHNCHCPRACADLSLARVPPTGAAGFRQRVFPRHLGACWGVPMPGRACLLAGAGAGASSPLPAPAASLHGVRAHSTATPAAGAGPRAVGAAPVSGAALLAVGAGAAAQRSGSTQQVGTLRFARTLLAALRRA